MIMQPQPHDLLWGITVADLASPVPDWVKEVVQRGDPVVMRRAVTHRGMIPVGIRGVERYQRYKLEMPSQQIKQIMKPEQLCQVELEHFPHLAKQLQRVQQTMKMLPWIWGYTGSVGFELATGIQTVTENSDIDLLIRTEGFLTKDEAKQLLYQLEQTELKLDVQLQTPKGGVALKEWARTTGKVLLKRNDGAVLVNNPWQ